jgi:hypothetical protein
MRFHLVQTKRMVVSSDGHANDALGLAASKMYSRISSGIRRTVAIFQALRAYWDIVSRSKSGRLARDKLRNLNRQIARVPWPDPTSAFFNPRLAISAPGCLYHPRQLDMSDSVDGAVDRMEEARRTARKVSRLFLAYDHNTHFVSRML